MLNSIQVKVEVEVGVVCFIPEVIPNFSEWVGGGWWVVAGGWCVGDWVAGI